MRLPLTPQLSTKDGISNKNARLTNVLKEVRQVGEIAQVRPGLVEAATATGSGDGLVCFDGELVSVFGTNLAANITVSETTTTTTTHSGGQATPPSAALPKLVNLWVAGESVLYGAGYGRTDGGYGINSVDFSGTTLVQEFPATGGGRTFLSVTGSEAALYGIDLTRTAWSLWSGSTWGTPVVKSNPSVLLYNTAILGGVLHHVGYSYYYPVGAPFISYTVDYRTYNLTTGTEISTYSWAFGDVFNEEDDNPNYAVYSGTSGGVLYVVTYFSTTGELTVSSVDGETSHTVLLSTTITVDLSNTIGSLSQTVFSSGFASVNGNLYFSLRETTGYNLVHVYRVDLAAETVELFHTFDGYVPPVNWDQDSCGLVGQGSTLIAARTSINNGPTPAILGDTQVVEFTSASGTVISTAISAGIYDFAQSPL